MFDYKPPYTITNEMILLLGQIMQEIGKIDSVNLLNRLPKLRKQNRIKSVYSTCYIEANSLSIDQVSDIINGKNVIGPLKEIQEVKNAIEAYELID